jgi:hypothetical protein
LAVYLRRDLVGSGAVRLAPRHPLLAGALGLALAGCGGGSDDQEAGRPVQAGGDGPVHVHGLGLNPRDGALFIATHTGIFRAAPGEPKAERVGDSTQDTMGFTVAGPDRFLGSGHPGEFDNAVNPLGLIRSRDGGQSWENVSLEGEADFHVLRFGEGRVYGYDAGNGRLMASADRGGSWKELAAPAPLLDLVPKPGAPNELVASGEGGLYRSSDGGRSWDRAGREIGFLGWPSPPALLLVDARGVTQVSRDGGRSWRQLGAIGGQPAAFLVQDERELYAALPDGTVKRSADGGRTWSVRSAP